MAAAINAGQRRPGKLAIASSVSALLFVLVVLRRRLLRDDFAKKRKSAKHGNTPLNTPQMEAAQRQLYVPLENGARELLVPDGNSGRVKHILIKPTKDSTFQAHRPFFTASTTSTQLYTPTTPAAPGRGANRGVGIDGKPAAAGQSAAQASKKVAVNKEFLRQLRAIFKILIPRCAWRTCTMNTLAEMHSHAGLRLRKCSYLPSTPSSSCCERT
jgi:ATP-binding cassette subfamily D (ALD) long-chain fatty acid import protein